MAKKKRLPPGRVLTVETESHHLVFDNWDDFFVMLRGLMKDHGKGAPTPAGLRYVEDSLMGNAQHGWLDDGDLYTARILEVNFDPYGRD